jgi:pyridoxal phosphate enzyme (YggS family)
MVADIKTNVCRVLENIAKAASRAGRKPDSIKLVAVSKTVDPERINVALEAGIQHLGENRVQDGMAKKPQLCSLPFTYHLIGPLQKNKVNKAVETFDWIQTVDSLDLAMKMNQTCERLGKRMPVLIEINQGKELSKSGVFEENVGALFEQASLFRNLIFLGLMSVPPFAEDPETVRPYFARLRAIAEEFAGLSCSNLSLVELSMGMSHDYQVAIEEGATIVRVGTAIFGSRN